jgi:hypothetical protein
MLNNDVDPIVRRARSKLSMRWRYAEAQATVLLYDRFAVPDRERTDVDSKLGGKRHRLVRRERRPRRQTRRASACRSLHHRPLGQYGWCLRSARHPGSFHGSRRVTQFLQWAAPPPLARVTQAERRELRLAVSSAASSEPAIEGGNVRALFEQRLMPLARHRRSLCRALGCTRSARSRRRRSLFDYLVDRFGKPLRRFNTLAPLDARSQRNAIVSHTRTQVCYVLNSWLRHYASDFLADSELFAAQLLVAVRRLLPTRSQSGTACRRARRRCRFTASGRRTSRRPRKCSSTAATSSIRRAARCDYHPVEVARQNGAGGARRLLCSCDRAS